MDGARTRGQPAAVAAIEGMIRRGRAPHAILLVGPDGVGKTTLALDLAAGMLCEAEPSARPCRSCRACRMVEHGGHPDLHRLTPAGPGRQVVIGGPGARFRGIRDLVAELAFLPVEGGARIAIIEGAERMNEDAQSALLKTLEEPPAGVVIVLCADQETRLLPTVRSRCARIRLGLLGSRDIEAILGDHELADPPLAARLGRLASGRPGLALAYARAPEAVLIRAELGRILLDLTGAGAAARLTAVRSAMPRAMALAGALMGGQTPPVRRGRRRGPAGTVDPSALPSDNAAPIDPGGADDGAPADDAGDVPDRSAPAMERRQAAEILVGLWADVGRDLALVGAGGARSVHDPILLEELAAASNGLDPAEVASFLAQADRAVELLTTNVSPELVLDSLALAWPRRSAVA